MSFVRFCTARALISLTLQISPPCKVRFCFITLRPNIKQPRCRDSLRQGAAKIKTRLLWDCKIAETPDERLRRLHSGIATSVKRGRLPVTSPRYTPTPITRTGVFPRNSLLEVLQQPTFSCRFFLQTSLGQTIPEPPRPPPHRECFSLESTDDSMRAYARVCVYVRVSVIKTLTEIIKLENFCRESSSLTLRLE